MKNYKHALLVMDRLEFPEEAKKAIANAEEKIIANEKANKIYESMYRAYWLKKKNFHTFSDKVKALAEEIGEHVYTVNLVLLLNCTKPLLAKYKAEGISEDIYWNTVVDLRCKMLECKENYDVWGTFVEGWFMGFYTLDRSVSADSSMNFRISAKKYTKTTALLSKTANSFSECTFPHTLLRSHTKQEWILTRRLLSSSKTDSAANTSSYAATHGFFIPTISTFFPKAPTQAISFSTLSLSTSEEPMISAIAGEFSALAQAAQDPKSSRETQKCRRHLPNGLTRARNPAALTA